MLNLRASAYTLGRRLSNYNAARLHAPVIPPGRTLQVLNRFQLSTSTANFSSIPPVPNGSDVGDRPLCREDFVLPDHVKVALDKGTMFVFAEASDLKEVPLADSIKESGVIPPGYSIDFIVSPERIISVLNQVGIKTIGYVLNLDLGLVEYQVKAPDNYRKRPTTRCERQSTIPSIFQLLIPTSVYEIKCQLQAQTDRESEEQEMK
ncbi:hypothetical protein F5890DRAFT_1566339 [Lentinula detonsa]|uniref:Uncharacterized protein n=1 Tax=Lentinula detonsa TaxID=2804962 RepID=A0AA38PYQ5_9AGAR|nr:hypothetical protein F5890DRAFT_1566339 [Lentinula detonsa]